MTEQQAGDWGVVRCNGPSDVAARCDILSVHLAACGETKNLIDAKVLGELKPGSYFINTARAEVVDYDALRKVVNEKGVRVGLDVYPQEPSSGKGEFSSALVGADGIVYGTHHIGASTDQAQRAIAQETVNIVKEYKHSGQVRNCVNLVGESRAKYIVVVRHRNRPGVLAHTLNVISYAGVNVEEMENVICEGAESACAHIKLDGPLGDQPMRDIKEGNEHIFAVSQGQVADTTEA